MYRITIPNTWQPRDAFSVHRDVVRFVGGAGSRYLYRIEGNTVLVQTPHFMPNATPVVVPQTGTYVEFVVRCNAIERVSRSREIRRLRAMPEIELYARRIIDTAAASILCIDRTVVQTYSGKHAALHAVDIFGVLRVNDQQLLYDHIGRGFGRAKAFGCGLMVLKTAAAD